MSNGTKWATLARQQGYLTDEQTEAAAADMSSDYYDRTKAAFNEMFGVGSWDALSWKAQSILTDYEYNARNGLRGFPKFAAAINKGDIDTALKESLRHSNGKSLDERNKYMHEELELLRTILSDGVVSE